MLLSTQFLFSLAVPLVQTIRLPHFSAMKAGFALSGLGAVPALMATALAAIPYERLRTVLVGTLWACTVAVGVADAAFVVNSWRAE